MKYLQIFAIGLACLGGATLASAQQAGTSGFDTGPDVTPGKSTGLTNGMSYREGNWESRLPAPDRARYRNYLVAQDYRGHVEFLATRAQEGNVWAMVRLRSIYGRGEIVEADIARSLNWYATAASRGDAGSALLLGAVYARGEVVRADPEKAQYWLSLAAELGDYRIKQDAEKVLASL